MSGSDLEFRDFESSFAALYLATKVQLTNRTLVGASPAPPARRWRMRLVLTIAAFLGVLYLFYTTISLLGAVAML